MDTTTLHVGTESTIILNPSYMKRVSSYCDMLPLADCANNETRMKRDEDDD